MAGSKKRKASELENATKDVKVGGSKKTGAKRKASNTDDIPFRYECPVKNSAKLSEDAFIGTDTIAEGFRFDFAVHPGPLWRRMKSYRNVKYSDTTFSTGDIIYVNKTHPPPKPPSPDATDAELLQWDRINLGAARIADTRASSENAVFLRVHWFYWPEELPMGRQPYHADRELILSNAMEILDAQCIASPAEVSCWDENDLEATLAERFWRQTFDISLLGKDRKGGLSELRKHCRCQEAFNPDKIMYQCKESNCKAWNHEQCLIDDVTERAWDQYEKGTLANAGAGHTKTEDHRHNLLTDLSQYVQKKIRPAVNAVAEQAIAHKTEETNGDDSSQSPKKKGRPKKPETIISPILSNPWDGRLNVRILPPVDEDADTPLYAKVDELTSDTSKKVKQQNSTSKSWTVQVCCLICGSAM